MGDECIEMGLHNGFFFSIAAPPFRSLLVPDYFVVSTDLENQIAVEFDPLKVSLLESRWFLDKQLPFVHDHLTGSDESSMIYGCEWSFNKDYLDTIQSAYLRDGEDSVKESIYNLLLDCDAQFQNHYVRAP